MLLFLLMVISSYFRYNEYGCISMLQILKLEDHKEFIREYFELCLKEWGTYFNQNEFEKKISTKVTSYLNGNMTNIISVIILVENNELLGFISLFQTDGNERVDLTPWYATMYVKENYRHHGYSKILSQAILEQAKYFGYQRVYLKSNLKNYYEKFGAQFMEVLNNGEKLYYIDIL